jgi:hypothetical protein
VPCGGGSRLQPPRSRGAKLLRGGDLLLALGNDPLVRLGEVAATKLLEPDAAELRDQVPLDVLAVAHRGALADLLPLDLPGQPLAQILLDSHLHVLGQRPLPVAALELRSCIRSGAGRLEPTLA